MERRVRTLCKIPDGSPLSIGQDRYFIDGDPLPTEDAIILLIQCCDSKRGLRQSLRGVIPDLDWRIIDRELTHDAYDSSIPLHQAYLVHMLEALHPPDTDCALHFERIHRAVLSGNLDDESLRRSLPLLHGCLWHHTFGDVVRTHRPRTSPLDRWTVLSQLKGSKDSGFDIERHLKREVMWCHSEERIRMEAAALGEEVISAVRS